VLSLNLSLNLPLTLADFFSILLVRWRENRDHAQRAAGPTGNFHRQGDHVEFQVRKITKVGKIFEHRHVLGEERDMRFKFVRLTIINRRGVDPDGFDLPLAHEPGRRLGMQAWEMERSYRLRPSQLCSQIL